MLVDSHRYICIICICVVLCCGLQNLRKVTGEETQGASGTFPGGTEVIAELSFVFKILRKKRGKIIFS